MLAFLIPIFLRLFLTSLLWFEMLLDGDFLASWTLRLISLSSLLTVISSETSLFSILLYYWDFLALKGILVAFKSLVDLNLTSLDAILLKVMFCSDLLNLFLLRVSFSRLESLLLFRLDFLFRSKLILTYWIFFRARLWFFFLETLFFILLLISLALF